MGFQNQAVKIRLPEGHVPFGADPLIHRLHGRGAPIDHRMAVRLENAGLGFRDFLHGVPKILGVIQADVGNHRHLGHLDDIGGVPGAAHAHLQHHNIAFLPIKILEGDAADQLEFRGRLGHGVSQGLHIFRNFRQILIGNLHPVHLNPLMEAVDIGRGVQPRPIARLAQNGGGHGGGASLAVGTGNVDEFQLFLRISHFLQKLLGSTQSGDAALPADGMDVGNGLLGVHIGFFLSAGGTTQSHGAAYLNYISFSGVCHRPIRSNTLLFISR